MAVLGVQVLLRLELLSFAGTLATAALLGLAADRDSGGWPQRAGLAGLTALTLAAAAVDIDAGGFGWPVAVGAHAGVVAVLLLTAGAALLAVAVLGTAAPGLRRRHLWPAGLAGVVVVGVFAKFAITDRPGRIGTALLGLSVVALVLVLVAANAALVTHRLGLAGAGLLAVLAFAGGAVGAAADFGAEDGTVGCERPWLGADDGVVWEWCSQATLRNVTPDRDEQRSAAAVADAQQRFLHPGARNPGNPGNAGGGNIAGQGNVAAVMVSVAPAETEAEGVDWEAGDAALRLLGLAALVMALFPPRQKVTLRLL
ncbi:hypothetical protein BJ973_009739 [Actinoplanes tereljensis]|uniref:hypothetical protein n=1 Tax=Paractinoplanes tereljensis TaxID=571912 RepID=UPI0019442856|nr:hypothetical protein [Actinoplanes tereljensis]